MGALSPENFLRRLSDHREAFWEKLSAERKSYGAEKPLTPEIILRRLQFGVVMERKAAEVSAPWVSRLPELELQHCLSEYVANELKQLWDFHSTLGSFCELFASVQYGHEEFFPRTSKSFIERVEPIDPQTASIYRDTLLADEAGHEWLAPEILKRYATDASTQTRCLEALQKGCELFGRAIQSFNRSLAS